MPGNPSRSNYPELLTPALAGRSLYETKGQLVRVLREFCRAPERARSCVEEVRACSSRFDWPKRVKEFDDAVEALAGGA